MAGLWDKLSELKNEHGDLSKYVSRMENVFSTSNEEGESAPENQDPDKSPTGLEPPQIRVTEPGTGERERRPSMASMVSSIMSLGGNDKLEDGTGQSDQAQLEVTSNEDAVAQTAQLSQTAQPPGAVPALTDISKPPEVQTVQPTKATNGAVSNGHHIIASNTPPAKGGKGSATGALIFSVCTLILCPVSFLCTIPSCICAIMDLKSTKKSTSKLSTFSFLLTAFYYVICAIIASFALGGIIFGGASFLKELIALFDGLIASFEVPGDEFMTTVMFTEAETTAGTTSPAVSAG